MSSSLFQQVCTGYTSCEVTRAPVSIRSPQQPRSVPKNHTKWFPAHEELSGPPTLVVVTPRYIVARRYGKPLARWEPVGIRSGSLWPSFHVRVAHVDVNLSLTDLLPHDPRAEHDIPRHGKGRKYHPCLIGRKQISCAGNSFDLGLAKLQAFSVDGMQGFPTKSPESSV